MELIEIFSKFGLNGLVIGILFYQVVYLQRRLMTIIENNTKAFTELKDNIERCGHNNG